MHVERLELRQFRNIEALRLDCPEELHLFVGPNAQGKTNILESLYLLSIGKSHRTRKDKEMVRWDGDAARIQARIRRQDRVDRLEIRLSAKGKKVVKNGLEQRKLSEYIGSLTAVLFAPEDLTIVKGSPQVRRRFIDMELGQMSPWYIHQLTRYNQLLAQRNQLLKDTAQGRYSSGDLLDVLDEQLIDLSTDVWIKRMTFVDQLTRWARDIHTAITQERESLQIQYQPSISLRDRNDAKAMAVAMADELRRIRKQEILRGSTLIGPHRDDLKLMVDGMDLHRYGSQGQQRTAALSLKLAEIELIRSETGTYPILLLDDVLSELDDFRKTHLLEAIRGKVQTFVTATGLEGIDGETINRARIYRVRQGSISEQG
ncbi:DNA replication/repair protein RecF [Desmospora profundinema]|uniref:DNA replication and repair protein RecF n=1 Tax=Desmospora profundinema TaxID=1571184 RepID=A0ABU1IKR0_9BACL|nr:DNA replication/repair protein RecF [Desmospora profundinema]MDR6225361.1 DNA replication and repair protein RecF [Desmospora profundinema]